MGNYSQSKIDKIKKLCYYYKRNNKNKMAQNSPDYPSDEEYKKILSDPKWIYITEMAQEIIKKIDFDKIS